jgi:hypothetical protein
MRSGLAIKSETGGFGGMVGSPNFHHPPPQPKYLSKHLAVNLTTLDHLLYYLRLLGFYHK